MTAPKTTDELADALVERMYNTEFTLAECRALLRQLARDAAALGAVKALEDGRTANIEYLKQRLEKRQNAGDRFDAIDCITWLEEQCLRLTAQIAAAQNADTFEEAYEELCRIDTSAVMPAKAAAWDEGFSHAIGHYRDDKANYNTDNPYRAATYTDQEQGAILADNEGDDDDV